MQWSFKLHNGRHIIKDTDKTTLAFNNADDARLWHQTFQSVIADLAAKQGVEVSCSQSVIAPGYGLYRSLGVQLRIT